MDNCGDFGVAIGKFSKDFLPHLCTVPNEFVDISSLISVTNHRDTVCSILSVMESSINDVTLRGGRGFTLL